MHGTQVLFLTVAALAADETIQGQAGSLSVNTETAYST